jgi:hypothetical protein
MRRVVVMLLVSASLLVINVSAVSAAPPSNDRFGQAIVFGGIPFSHSVDTSDATRSASDPRCEGNAHTVWYRFRPSTDGDIVATTALARHGATADQLAATIEAITYLATLLGSPRMAAHAVTGTRIPHPG